MNDRTKKILVAIVVAVIVCAAAFLCSRSRADVPDNGNRADDAREQLERARLNQQAAEGQLDEASDTAKDLGGEITGIREEVHEARITADGIKEDNDRAGQLITECREILERVHRRGESQAGEN